MSRMIFEATFLRKRALPSIQPTDSEENLPNGDQCPMRIGESLDPNGLESLAGNCGGCINRW